LLVYQFCRSCNKLKGFIGNLPENNSSPKLIQIIMRGADECKLPYKHAKKWKIAKNWFETLQLKSPLGKRHKGHLSQAYTYYIEIGILILKLVCHFLAVSPPWANASIKRNRRY